MFIPYARFRNQDREELIENTSSLLGLILNEELERNFVCEDVKNILRVWSKYLTSCRDNPCHILLSLPVIQIQNNVNHFKQLGHLKLRVA